MSRPLRFDHTKFEEEILRSKHECEQLFPATGEPVCERRDSGDSPDAREKNLTPDDSKQRTGVGCARLPNVESIECEQPERSPMRRIVVSVVAAVVRCPNPHGRPVARHA